MSFQFDTNTFKFKTVMPDYESFKSLIKIYIPNMILATDSQQENLFKLLFNNFCNCSVAYDTIDAFYRHFFIEYANSCDEYVKKLELIKTLREMPLDELSKEMRSISNIAQNDNSIVNNPLQEIIPYISTQSTSSTSSNEALAIHRALTIYRDNETYNFLDRFKKLFITIHGDKQAFYKN